MAHKLLLADDSVTIQRVIELTFLNEDIEVTAVGDGQMAIECVDAHPPDIILADIDMPKRDGYEVAAYVKSRPELAHIPVVLMTGAFEPVDHARASAAGSSDVLAKPFEPQMVINRVKELLGRKRPDAAYVSHEASAHGREPQMDDIKPAGREPAPAGEGQTVSLDDYFDQLDAAFSNLQPGAAPSDGSDGVDWPADLQTTTAAINPPPFTDGPERSAPVAQSAASLDSHASSALEAPTPTAVASAPIISPAPAAPETNASIVPAAHAHAASATAPHAPVPDSPPKPSVNPFATLSAVKAEAAARPAPVVSDEVIDQIVARVLHRMSDHVVRETVTEIVSQTAERLVQEEIERIRSGT